MTDLTKLTLVESIKHVKEKKCSASELVSAYVKRIEKSDKLNCFNTKDLENAVSKAKKIDANKKLDKALVGAPIAVKDLFCTKGKKQLHLVKFYQILFQLMNLLLHKNSGMKMRF